MAKRRRKLRPGTRPARNTGGHTGGRPGFVPTPSERAFVTAMSGLKMTHDEICKVIGNGRNGGVAGRSGRPIAKTTLHKYFKNELANGSALLKAKVAGRFYAALDADAPWAVQMATRNRFNWDAGRGGFDGAQLSDLLDDNGIQPTVAIEFVIPGKREPDPAPIPGQRLLPPLSPQLRKNEFGVWEEFRGNGGGTGDRPPKPGDWMG
jgi:hypothetical protein